jgi:hypothetical protein
MLLFPRWPVRRKYTIAPNHHGAPWWVLPTLFWKTRPVERVSFWMHITPEYAFLPTTRSGEVRRNQVNKGPGIMSLIGPDFRSVRVGWVSDLNGGPVGIGLFVEGPELKGLAENNADFYHTPIDKMFKVPVGPGMVCGTLEYRDGRWVLCDLTYGRLQGQIFLYDRTSEHELECPFKTGGFTAGWFSRVWVGGKAPMVPWHSLPVDTTVVIK